MFKILLGMLIIISSVVYTGDLAELKNINSLFVDETKNIVKKCVLATDNYQPYFNVNLYVFSQSSCLSLLKISIFITS